MFIFIAVNSLFISLPIVTTAMPDPSSVVSHNDATIRFVTYSGGLWSIGTIMQCQLFSEYGLYLRGDPAVFQLKAYDSPQTIALMNKLDGIDTSQYLPEYIAPFVVGPTYPIDDNNNNNNDSIDNNNNNNNNNNK